VIAVNQPHRFRRGSVGPLIEDIEVRIADDGEILTKGPHVMMGYWQDAAATDEAIEDGWLKTGDLGHLDDDGFLFVRGRKKEIIVLATGKNVSPALVEGTLTASPLIEQAFVVGDDRKYLAALIVPSTAARQRASEQGTSLKELMQVEVQQRCTALATYEQVRTFTLLDRPFSIEQGELTAKLSLRRDVIGEHFRNEIAAMYRTPAHGGEV